jgi:hypothetical protein
MDTNKPMRFCDVVEAADSLSFEEKEELIGILEQRMRDERRAKLLQEVEQSRKDFAEGRYKAGTVDEIMREILS